MLPSFYSPTAESTLVSQAGIILIINKLLAFMCFQFVQNILQVQLIMMDQKNIFGIAVNFSSPASMVITAKCAQIKSHTIIYIHMGTHIHTHTHVCTHTHIHTHTHMHAVSHVHMIHNDNSYLHWEESKLKK